jgi:hypothetical protein
MLNINIDALSDDSGTDGNTEYKKETMHIPAGPMVARLAAYAELGWHYPVFNGKRKTYDTGKNAGKEKPAEYMLHLVFEFPACEYTGDFPLTIKTSVPYGNSGAFINALGVGRGLIEPPYWSRSIAMRTSYVRYLKALQDATGKDLNSLADFVGEAMLVTVTNNTATVKNKDGSTETRVYANMKPEGIVPPVMKDPMNPKKVIVLDVPEIIGSYWGKFDYNNPDPEVWKLLPKYLQDTCQRSIDFEGSSLQRMLAGMPVDIPAPPVKGTGKPVEPAADGLPDA